MTNGFADLALAGPGGFQTQLSRTSNKRRDEEAPLLEAFLDENGRVAYRFVDKDGNIVAQPKVTTPGFTQPGLGGSPITPPGGDPGGQPSITPQASGVLTGTIGGDRGQAGEIRGDRQDDAAPRIQTQPMSRLQRGLASTFAGPFSLPASLGLRGLQSLGAGVVGGGSPSPADQLNFQALTDATQDARTSGFATPDEFSVQNPDFDFTLGDRTDRDGGGGGASETAPDPTGEIGDALNDDMEDDFGSFDGLGGDGGGGSDGGGTGGGGTGADAGGGAPGDRR